MITIALPSGRIREQVRSLLNQAGIRLDFGADDKKLEPGVFGADGMKFFVVRSKDAATFVKCGKFDAAFIGRDMIEEVDADSDVEILLDTEADPIKLVLAARDTERDLLTSCLAGKQGHVINLATKYPRLVTNWLTERRCLDNFQIMPVDGSVEVYASLEERTVIADVTASGSTLRANALIPVETIRKSTTMLVANKRRLAIPEIGDALRFKTFMLRGVIEASKREMLSVNAALAVEKAVTNILAPAGMRSVDRIPSADGEGVSLSAAILSSAKYEVLRAVIAAGATDPIVLPIRFLA